MAETLGSLCDKLTIVKLKQWHSEDVVRKASLEKQEQMLQEEINNFVSQALTGGISSDKLAFAANKVFKPQEGLTIYSFSSIGLAFSKLAEINCKLWHEQEKVYEFEKVANSDKNLVVKNLALLNLERNQCIDQIDKNFTEICTKTSTK